MGRPSSTFVALAIDNIPVDQEATQVDLSVRAALPGALAEPATVDPELIEFHRLLNSMLHVENTAALAAVVEEVFIATRRTALLS